MDVFRRVADILAKDYSYGSRVGWEVCMCKLKKIHSFVIFTGPTEDCTHVDRSTENEVQSFSTSGDFSSDIDQDLCEVANAAERSAGTPIIIKV